MAFVCSSITAMVSGDSEYGGIAQARVAGVHARLLDVLHDPADDHLAGAVADGVDVDLGGVLEEAVDEHRAARRTGRPRGRGCRSRPAAPWPGASDSSS